MVSQLNSLRKAGAIILGNEYQALGLLRALKRVGVSCVLVDQDKYGLALFSRYKEKFFLSPSYTSKEFWPFLKQIAIENDYLGWIVIPTDDEQVRQLAENFNEVVKIFNYKGLDWENYQKIYNKRFAHAWVEKFDISSPNTYLPLSKNDFKNHGLNYPFIVKPAVKREYKNYSKKKAITVNSEGDLKKVLDETLAGVPIEDLIFQEIIPGDGRQQWSYAGLFVEGNPVAAYTACRMRQHPPDYGRASTYVIAKHDQEVEDLSKKLIYELKYTGLAEVEWKRDPRDNKLKFLEINARSWGWHSLSEFVVGNLPKMYFDYLINGKYSVVNPSYGMRWVKWITDLPVIIDLLKQKKITIKEYIKSINGNLVSCEWDKNDPLPFFLQFLLLPYLIIKRGY